jgi:hypothetical protein
LDCVWQLLQQAGEAFEFTEAYLLAIHTKVSSRRHGTFLCNSERERFREYNLPARTTCLWGALQAEQRLDGRFSNHGYVSAADGQAEMVAVDFTQQAHVHLWKGMYMPAGLPIVEASERGGEGGES